MTASLRREKLLDTWDFHEIVPGSTWEDELYEKLDTHDVIVMLVSPDFIQYDYCMDVELPRALKRRNAGEALVLPIVIRPCDWQNTELGKMQALPSGARPVSQWADADAAWQDATSGVRRLVAEALSTPSQERAGWAGLYETPSFDGGARTGASLRIRHLSDEAIEESGSAHWVNTAQHPDLRSAHTGVFGAVGRVGHDILRVGPSFGCVLDIRLTKQGVGVAQSGECGGMNVAFNGARLS